MPDTDINIYNNSAGSAVNRAGVGMSDKDALAELAERRTSTPAPSSSTSLTPQATSNDDADKAALAELQQRRTPLSQEPSQRSAQGRVAQAFEQLPATALEKPLGTPGGGIEKALQGPITNFYQQHPEIAGTLTGIVTAAALPEAALARLLPTIVRGGWGLAKYGAKKFTDYEILSHLLHP